MVSATLRRVSLAFALTLVMAVSLMPNVCAQGITAQTDKSTYYVNEPIIFTIHNNGPNLVTVYGSLYLDGIQISNDAYMTDIAGGGVYTETSKFAQVVSVKLEVRAIDQVTGVNYRVTVQYQVVEQAAGPTFDFTLTLSPASITVKQGETANYQILLTYGDPSYSGTTINVQVSGLGPGMNYQLIQSPAALSISTSQSTPTGSYTITITGSAQGVIHQASVILLVEPAMTEYSIDWALSNPSLSPNSPKVGDLVTFNIVVSQVSSDWPGSLTVAVKVILDGSQFDYLWVYEDQVIPTGLTKSVSTKPWTATAGAHLVTWELTFFGGDETVILRDPSVANNEASFQVVVTAASSTIRTVTQVQATTLTMTARQSSTKGAATFTIRNGDLIIVGAIAAIAIVIVSYVTTLRRHRHAPYVSPPTPTTGGPTVATAGFCVNCGAALKPDVKFCGACGERVE